MPFLIPFLLIAAMAGPLDSGPELVVTIDGLRNDRGVIQACLTRDEAHFPDCSSDPRAVRQTVPARTHVLRFRGFEPGAYAVAVIHDENNNNKLDTVLGMPREGFGFSRNPKIRFGAPRFRQASMQLDRGLTRDAIRMQYLL